MRVRDIKWGAPLSNDAAQQDMELEKLSEEAEPRAGRGRPRVSGRGRSRGRP